jgi:hypothetical protein
VYAIQNSVTDAFLLDALPFLINIEELNALSLEIREDPS